MLRDFEDEIVRILGAERVQAPSRSLPKFINGRLAHGTRYSGARRFVPKEKHELEADVLWIILMGPENFTLDLYKGWDKNVGVKILYFFDTFDAQLTSIRRVIKSTDWDFVSTAFHGAKPFLEEQTQHPWHLVRQAIKPARFSPESLENRVIDFSAYGRRLNSVHDAVKEYCKDHGKYYDYTTASIIHHSVDPREHYRQYAWHLCHSIFNFCWPVEVTNPDRVNGYSPITCRWFEAAASGAAILGQAPSEPGFSEIFGENAVIEMDHRDGNFADQLTEFWDNREFYLDRARRRRQEFGRNWSWESRIRQILETVGVPFERGAIETSKIGLASSALHATAVAPIE